MPDNPAHAVVEYSTRDPVFTATAGWGAANPFDSLQETRSSGEDKIVAQTESAEAFFDACETGKGWEVCRTWCVEDASFACQADALEEIATLAVYCDWMQGLLTPVPDGRYELTAFAWDEARKTAVATARFRGTQTGSGGPVPPTGRTVTSDYAYVMRFDGDKIAHMTKIWNDVHAMRGLGWV